PAAGGDRRGLHTVHAGDAQGEMPEPGVRGTHGESAAAAATAPGTREGRRVLREDRRGRQRSVDLASVPQVRQRRGDQPVYVNREVAGPRRATIWHEGGIGWI